jgi:hypothetical protein
MRWGSLCVAREAPKAPRLRHCSRPTWVDLPLAVPLTNDRYLRKRDARIRPEPTFSGHAGPWPLTPQLGGKRAYAGRLGRTGVRAKAVFPFRARFRLRRSFETCGSGACGLVAADVAGLLGAEKLENRASLHVGIHEGVGVLLRLLRRLFVMLEVMSEVVRRLLEWHIEGMGRARKNNDFQIRLAAGCLA